LSFEEIFENDIKSQLGKDADTTPVEGQSASSVAYVIRKTEYRLNSKERAHMSRIRLDSNSNVVYINTGELKEAHYTDIEPRYIAAVGLIYDILISIHDVNSKSTFVYRPYGSAPLLHDGKLRHKILSLSKSRPNLEARIIGFQNNQDYGQLLDDISNFIIKNRIKLVEVDLFGSNARHIAIDTKLGMSFDILLDNRPYKQGELVNNITIENFEKGLKDKQVPAV
jgi:hypothetical protein